MIKVFLAGKYTGKTKEETRENIQTAEDYSVRLWNMGYSVFCPHLNTKLFEEKSCKATYEDYIQFTLAMIPSCDVMFLLPNWKDSPGSIRERAVASECNIPIAYSIKDLTNIKSDLFGNGLDTTLRLYDKNIARARQRIIRGHKQYGMDWIDKDNIKELKEEYLDAANYPILELMKLEHRLKNST